MLRWTLPVLLTLAAANTALGADLPAYRLHYGPPPQVYVEPPPIYVEDPALISPPTTPILPGSSTLPGYYGTGHSYSYDGAYYGGPQYGPYWARLPYACGVFGYC
jgi:hypothetical protein